jgi:Icc-related predicted phosphoesterase
MRILHVSDLHFQQNWFEWLLNAAPNYDLVCIAGDWLEGRETHASFQTQIDWIYTWKKRFIQTNVPLITCSGNHDLVFINGIPWIKKINHNSFVPDNTTRRIKIKNETLIVTTLPYTKTKSTEKLWEKGAREKEKTGGQWLVVNHVPPQNSKLALKSGCPTLHENLETFQPDYLLCGHEHLSPYTEDHSGYDVLTHTQCINPGQIFRNHDIPNHCEIDTLHNCVTWNHYEPISKKYAQLLYTENAY